MLASLFAILAIGVFIVGILYDRRNRTRWEEVGGGVWMQRTTSKYKAHFIFRTSDAIDPSSLAPALWQIKKPFSDNPKYISQHPEQLRIWWEPMALQFAELGRDPKHIKALSFAPSLGIYIQMDNTKKTTRPPGEDLMVMLMQEAKKTWKPRRFEVDGSYPIRESIVQNWHWPFAAATGVLIHGLVQYSYVDFMGDRYYAATGLVLATVTSLALAFWYFPKMEGSVHRLKTLGHIILISAGSLGMSIPYGLVGVNMLSKQAVCDTSALVTEWYSRSGKNRTYYADLDLRECSSRHIPSRLSIKVSRADYQRGNKINIRVSRGILGRYYLEIK